MMFPRPKTKVTRKTPGSTVSLNQFRTLVRTEAVSAIVMMVMMERWITDLGLQLYHSFLLFYYFCQTEATPKLR